ncbi:MAG: anti-sigma F factor antagonist [Clostridiales bacterium]|mgnify:FL=1|uniref:anti-sigma F factor antagonist n=1 Tax=Terrisporobacter sp. TaxID=1965305 RepID=UPI002A41F6AB|nr:anti-sigma F factor antagonist [Terrisporobacter sp.]MCI5630322.1 anti-sigma F factor antagonist [Clostridium sp.]MDD5878875.1 anti-sigma F factor antagonist [Clostridiales bacterium]MCI6457613.1 anti-sigma F factor antagonist [Clostridium sp.]MCI7207504.1 anti-sigma F factor antagonist [Clostridium sp.]MDD7754409.1 anti-sigma F factor antagonist [Clostridiales bacterium]
MIKCYLENKTLLIEILSKELDHHVAREMRIEVDDILMKKQVDYIIFDFEYVNFMDSSGIGVIIGRYKKIASHGGRVSVINMNSRLKKLFNLSGMNKIINIYDTFEDAINS